MTAQNTAITQRPAAFILRLPSEQIRSRISYNLHIQVKTAITTKLIGAGRDVARRRPLQQFVGRMANAPHLMSSSVNQLRLHFSDIGAGESARGVDLPQTFLGLLRSKSGVDGEEAELGVDVGIGDVLLDIVVTLEPHGKDLAPRKQRLGLEALFLSHGTG